MAGIWNCCHILAAFKLEATLLASTSLMLLSFRCFSSQQTERTAPSAITTSVIAIHPSDGSFGRVA